MLRCSNDGTALLLSTSVPIIVNLLSGTGVPMPTSVDVELVNIVVSPVEFQKLAPPPEPVASVPQLKTPVASVLIVSQLTKSGNATLPLTFKVPEIFAFPITTSFSAGEVVPMPMLPD